MKPTDHLTLSALRDACREYRDSTNYDLSLRTLRNSTARGGLSLEDRKHRLALLTWLNAWNCRQFKKEYHGEASQELLEWGRKWVASLPQQHQHLTHLSDRELTLSARAYGDLSGRRACLRERAGQQVPVTFGPTGAAKILYALRPEVFPPWDTSIRHGLGFDGSWGSYRRFLVCVKARIEEVFADAERLGLQAHEIPAEVGREEMSLPKLIDEFHWVTLTAGYQPPRN
jgi:hypothetical protein